MSSDARVPFRASYLAVVLVLAAILVVPVPGSLSLVVTRAAGLLPNSSWAGITSDVGLLILAAATGLTLAVAWLRSPHERVIHISCAVGAAAVLAVSESTKAWLQQERPCQQWMSESSCPPAGDWSFPSNHAALAFAAVAVLVLVARTRWVTIGAAAVATAVGVSRIVEQHHYLHDVVAGAILGLTVPIACARAAVCFRNHASRSRWKSGD